MLAGKLLCMPTKLQFDAACDFRNQSQATNADALQRGEMVLTQNYSKAVTDILSMIRPANSEVSVPKMNKEIYKASQSIYVTVLSI